jgi:hypothetical protein
MCPANGNASRHISILMCRSSQCGGDGDRAPGMTGFSVVDVKDPPHFVVVIFSPAPEWFRRWTEVTDMLDFYFKYPGVLRRMRRGPLASDIDDLADEFARLGYTHATARRYLSLLATFSRYAERVGYLRPETIDVVLVERFLQKVRRSACTRSVARSALGHAVRRLARRFPTTVTPAAPDNPDDLLLAAFGSYLRKCEVCSHGAVRASYWSPDVYCAGTAPRSLVRRFRILGARTSWASSRILVRRALPTGLGPQRSLTCVGFCAIYTGRACSGTTLRGSSHGYPSGG